MFSKLHVWNLIEYNSILYLDSDTLAVKSPARIFTDVIPQMHESGVELAMANLGPRWSDFNAGVMIVLPGFTSVKQMRESINTTHFNTYFAEQSFLNAFFQDRIFQLPYSFNDPFYESHPLFIHMIGKPWQRYPGENWTKGVSEFWLLAPPANPQCSFFY